MDSTRPTNVGVVFNHDYKGDRLVVAQLIAPLTFMVVGTLRGMPDGIHTVDLVCRPLVESVYTREITHSPL